MRCCANRTLCTGFGKRLRFFELDFDTIARRCDRTIALQADGKVVIAGPANSDFGIAGFTSVGALDSTFDTDGRMLIDFFSGFDAASDVLVQPDGKLVVAGAARNGTGGGLGIVRVVP